MIERRKRGAEILIGILLLAGTMAYAEHVPSSRSGEPDYQVRLNIAKAFGDIEPFTELLGRLEEGEFRYRAFTLGAYYRAHPNLKVGAFYTLASGIRHDDDWLDLSPGWEWDDTRERPEQILTLDVSPRFLTPFLPGRNWVFMLKNRYSYNTFNGNQTLLVRPGLNYIHMKERSPVFNLGFQYGVYFPLNFSKAVIYEHDPYLNLVYHLSKKVKLELFGAYKIRTWTDSQDVIDAAESSYEVSDTVFVLGAGLIIRL